MSVRRSLRSSEMVRTRERSSDRILTTFQATNSKRRNILETNH